MKQINVPYISQKGTWPTGCESVSAVMLLQYLGLSVSVETFVDRYLKKQPFEVRGGKTFGGHPDRVFCGDPRSEDGFGCYAGVIVDTLNRIFADQETASPFCAVNETGTSMKHLLEQYIDQDMPVVFWACIDMKEPITGPSWMLTDTGEEFTWISNEHCLLLVGYDDDSYIFNDPHEGHGVIRYPRELVEERHAAQYAMAVGVQRGENKSGLKRLDRKLACQGGIVDLYKDTVMLPDGKIQEWDYVHHKNGGGACVVPVLPDGRILMIRQYRPAVDAEVLELPAGGREGEAEPTAAAALRELREETGYICRKPEFLLTMKTAVAYCNEFTDIYLCENIVPAGDQIPDEAEDIALQPYALEDLLSMIRSAELYDAKSIAGILAYADLLHKRSAR